MTLAGVRDRVARLAHSRRRPFGDLAAEIVGKRRQDVVDHHVVGDVARLHVDVGLGVDRVALVDQPIDDLDSGSPSLRSGRLERRLTRDRIRSRSAFSQIEMAFCLDGGAGLRLDEGAAAGRQHLRGAVEEALDDAALAVAEIGLAVAVEDLVDGGVRRLLDLAVGVDEGQAETDCEPPADRRLAGAHHADHDDGTAVEQPGHSRFQRLAHSLRTVIFQPI